MQTALIITGVAIIIFVVLTLRAKAKMKNIPLANDHEKIISLTDKNFQHQTRGKIVLVDFWAAWCGPCRLMAPVLNEIAGELKENYHVGKVNVEEYQSLSDKFKIRGIPTMVLLKNGVEVNRFVGVKSREFLIKQIKSVSY